MLNSLSHEQIATITLWYLVQHSLSSFQNYTLQHFGTSTKAVAASNLQIWPNLGFTQSHLQRVIEIQTPARGQTKLQTLLYDVQASCDFILFDTESHYPSQLLPHSDRHRFYLVRAIHKAFTTSSCYRRQSKPSPHGKQVAYDFAYYLAERGFYIFAVVWLKALMQRHIRAA